MVEYDKGCATIPSDHGAVLFRQVCNIERVTRQIETAVMGTKIVESKNIAVQPEMLQECVLAACDRMARCVKDLDALAEKLADLRMMVHETP